MNVEGVGIIRPNPVRIELHNWQIQRLKKIADDRHVFRGYGNRTDQWGAGLAKNPILKGLIGEWATATFLRSQGLPDVIWDTELRPGGDGGVDLRFRSVGIQVKTGLMLIRRWTSERKMIPIIADVFVLCDTDCATFVNIDGWIFKERLERIGKRTRFGHFNLEVDPMDLSPMFQLVKFLKGAA